MDSSSLTIYQERKSQDMFFLWGHLADHRPLSPWRARRRRGWPCQACQARLAAVWCVPGQTSRVMPRVGSPCLRDFLGLCWSPVPWEGILPGSYLSAGPELVVPGSGDSMDGTRSSRAMEAGGGGCSPQLFSQALHPGSLQLGGTPAWGGLPCGSYPLPGGPQWDGGVLQASLDGPSWGGGVSGGVQRDPETRETRRPGAPWCALGEPKLRARGGRGTDLSTRAAGRVRSGQVKQSPNWEMGRWGGWALCRLQARCWRPLGSPVGDKGFAQWPLRAVCLPLWVSPLPFPAATPWISAQPSLPPSLARVNGRVSL